MEGGLRQLESPSVQFQHKGWITGQARTLAMYSVTM